jgi:UDP-GlcNAc3NAcA epimerase
MKVITVLGARPQFIKAAPVCRALDRVPSITSSLLHTGQHFDDEMSAVFFDELGLPAPDWNLGLGSGSHGQMTGRMLAAIEEVLIQEAPDWVIVFGDTNSTLAGALATAKLTSRLAHIEAGLRSFNRSMPEEINRVVTDHLSDLCFVPTSLAASNLADEGIAPERVVHSGDVMYDAALLFRERSRTRPAGQVVPTEGSDYILATVHRAENTDDPDRLRAVIGGLAAVAAHTPVILPLHPRTVQAVERLGDLDLAGITIVPPLGYLDMVALEAGASLIVTDSGGVQKEAFFYRRPCLTLRDETEWQELVDLGWNRVVRPQEAAQVAEAVVQALAAPPGLDATPYGDGTAAEQIVQALIEAGT